MGNITVTKTDFSGGVWKGVILSKNEPAIRATHQNKNLTGIHIHPGNSPEQWLVQINVPSEIIGDGVKTVLIHDSISDEVISSFSIVSGDVLLDDIRAQIDILRAELDLLKSVIRRNLGS